MFNLFFKKKHLLKDLIPKNYIDIHNHVLPGLDDGAKNLISSVGLVLEMKEIGFAKIIATPHTYPGLYENTNTSIENSFKKLKQKINGKIDISFASEYMIDKSLIKKAEEKSLLTIKNNYVLLEMSFISPPNNLYDVLFEIQVNGYVPIIAHPERYRFFFDRFNEYEKLKNIGCKFQINMLSLTGYYGKDIINISDKLIGADFVDYIGSDIHNMRHINLIRATGKSGSFVGVKKIDKLEGIFENNNDFK